jgi:hypothetical protein
MGCMWLGGGRGGGMRHDWCFALDFWIWMSLCHCCSAPPIRLKQHLYHANHATPEEAHPHPMLHPAM